MKPPKVEIVAGSIRQAKLWLLDEMAYPDVHRRITIPNEWGDPLRAWVKRQTGGRLRFHKRLLESGGRYAEAWVEEVKS